MTDTTDDGPAMVDTNIAVYAYDKRDPAKHRMAKDLIRRLSDSSRLVLSAQVLNEFSSVMMKPRRATPLTPDAIARLLRRFVATAQIVPVTPSLTFLALEGMARHTLSFWDALIWAAAKENGIALIYSEDFQDGRVIEGVRIVNPLVARPEGA
jgi:predicted nucleic acid-binding protein